MNFDIMAFLPIGMILLVFYFLLLRPRQKKMKEHQTMLSNLKRGDRVITSGGIIGSINKIVNETEILLEIADNVKVRVVKSMITEVTSKIESVETTAVATKKAIPSKKQTPIVDSLASQTTEESSK